MDDRARGGKGPRFIALAMLATAFVGCAISFDGYELESEGGLASTGGASGVAGSFPTGGGVTVGAGGDATAGDATAGNPGGAGNNEVGGSAGVTGAGGAQRPDASAGPGGGSGLDAGKAGSAGSGGSTATDAGPSGCPVGGAPMTELAIPVGALGYPGTYCIDRTEVTNKQYADFLAANPSTAGQPPYCAWNNTFAPQSSPGLSNCENVALVYDPTNHPLYPVACIDWCDARAYCKSIGKRLCGAFGGGGVAQGDGTSFKIDEWVNACSGGGARAYPYGATYQGAVCDGLDYGQASSIAVGLAVNCVTASGGIYDMSGNVAEWDDACNTSTGSSDLCLVRGGYYDSYDSPGNSAACAATPSTSRSRISRQIGFRCCYDGK